MSGAEEFSVKVVAPGRDKLERVVNYCSLYAKDGFLEIHPDHAPIAFAMGNGKFELFTGQQDSEKMAIYGGIAHFSNNELSIFTPAIEHLDEIDVERAQHALYKNRQRLAGKDPEIPRGKLDLKRAWAAKEKAILRLTLKGVPVDE